MDIAWSKEEKKYIDKMNSKSDCEFYKEMQENLSEMIKHSKYFIIFQLILFITCFIGFISESYLFFTVKNYVFMYGMGALIFLYSIYNIPFYIIKDVYSIVEIKILLRENEEIYKKLTGIQLINKRK